LNGLSRLTSGAEAVGRAFVRGIGEIGLAGTLLLQSLKWIAIGWRRNQPVRLGAVAAQAMEIGIRALPIVTILAATIGAMLAIQGIYTLESFGAEEQVTLGVALSVTREFAPLITGILVAGRSGSALAARLGTMKINQEIDALAVMGINPVRFLVAPALVAMVIMVPALTIWANIVATLGAGLYITGQLGMSMSVYLADVATSLTVDDVMHGLTKSVLFALLIVLIGVVNGASVTGGAEGVGRMTTRSVVHSIAAIVITDMVFVFLTTRL
jgi:phospholipid/cholesterol/gamma-HCH transport system permease protein